MRKKPNKLSILLLVLVVILGIPLKKLKASNPSDSIICLFPKEYDFYAQALVDRKQLRKDTTTYGKIFRSSNSIILEKTNQITRLQTALVAKDSITSIYKREYLVEKSIKESSNRKVSRLKNLSLVLGSLVVTLLAIIIIIH